MMFAGTQRTKGQKELNTRERKGQDATKISSAFADSCIQFPWSVMSILIRMLCLCLALMNLLFRVAPPSSCFVTMAKLTPHCVVKSDNGHWTMTGSVKTTFMKLSHYLDTASIWSSMSESMKPEKATKAPRNAGIDPSTMKMKQWYQGQNRVIDKSQWQWPDDLVSDKKAPTGTDRASYQAREPIEGDEERLAMRQGDMLPPVPERVTNPRIRGDRAGFQKELGKDAPCHFRRRQHKIMV